MGTPVEAQELITLFAQRRELKYKRKEMPSKAWEKEQKSLHGKITTATDRLMAALQKGELKTGRRQAVSVQDLARIRLWIHLEERNRSSFEKIMSLTQILAFFKPAESMQCANLWIGLGLDENDFSYKLCADGQKRDLSSIPWEKLELIIAVAKKGSLTLYGSVADDETCVLLL